jgi:DNA-binding response OmpR family regulator
MQKLIILILFVINLSQEVNIMDNKKPKTILLVEDDAMIAVVETIKLKKYGYNVIHVLNGQKAIETANDNSNSIYLILMDINLGEKLDGTE